LSPFLPSCEWRLTGPTAPQIDDFRATVSILLQYHAVLAVEGVADALSTTNNTFVLIIAEAAFVADAHERRRPHVGVAYGALAVAFVAKAPDGDAGLLAAHYEIGVVARHVGVVWCGV